MTAKKISIFPGVSVYVSDEMLDMLEQISNNSEIMLNLVNDEQKKLLKEMFERNLLVRRRKNNEISYSVRPDLNWK